MNQHPVSIENSRSVIIEVITMTEKNSLNSTDIMLEKLV